MKHGFWTVLTAGVLAAGMAGCVKSETDAGDGVVPGAIDFGVSSESRAVINSSADMAEFHVWAYLDGLSPVFTKQLVTKENGRWVYEPLKLWEEGQYVFGAFYPVDLKTDRLSLQMMIQKDGGTEGGIAINHFLCTEGKDDLLTASHARKYDGTNGETVELDFKHLLSKVSIEAKAAGTEQDVVVHSVEFSGMAMVGTYRYDNGVYEPDGTWNAWRNQQGAVIGDFKEEANISSLPSNGASVSLLTDLLLIPQSVTADFKVTLDCTVDGVRKTLTASLPTQLAWEEGKAYRYTLTVRGDYITFEVNVVPWNTSTGGIITVE